MQYIKWILLYPISIAFSIFAFFTVPFVCLFTVKKPTKDNVKRFNKKLITINRDYLLPIFSWWATFDNAADEWWYGMYNANTKFAKNWTQDDYDKSWIKRYICRVFWHSRNIAYGFNLNVLGFTPIDATVVTTQLRQFKVTTWYSRYGFAKAFQVQGNLFITKSYYFNINIGWKAHKQVQKLMFAGRLLQFPRKA